MPEPGWTGLSWLFFWWRWKWVHVAIGHAILSGPNRSHTCNCGMTWDT